MTLIVVLLIAGLLLLLAETFLPGMIAGIIGALCLLVATILVFAHYGVEAGIYLFVTELVLAVIGFMLWMKLFPETRFGKQFILPENSNPSPISRDLPNLLRQHGKALTSLRPGGTIEIQGRRHDAVSEGPFVEAGEAIQVVKLDGQIIVVRKL
jgi:membrane-bound serine protease (ClpP class)